MNLLTIGISSFNLKYQIPSDIPQHNQFIPPGNLKSQMWLDEINKWTINQKMMVNEKKTKTMIFNCTDKYQFTTRLTMNEKPIEVITSTRLLGTILTDDLKWDSNCENLTKRANGRMEILRKVASFGLDRDELKNICFLFVSSVWYSSLTVKNRQDLERVRKSAVRLVMGDRYKGYKKSLDILEMENLNEKWEALCLNFAIKATKQLQMKKMFPVRKKHMK